MAPSDFRFLVVPHTHWDREWYAPFEVFRLRLGEVVGGVLETLEADPAFASFTLDGQAIVLEDFLDIRPEDEPRLRALLGAGRLEVGPWYVLPDELLVGGESLVRNLLAGRRVCRRFGVEPSGAGYQPDSFGHPAQLPQLLAGFGLGTFLFSRGLGDELDQVGLLFRWRAAGHELVASQLLTSYGNFAGLRSADDGLERIERIVEAFGERLAAARADTIVLANGEDHAPIQPELPGLCVELAERTGSRVAIGRYDDYRPAADALPVHEGELVSGRLWNILRGVNSSRIYLKQADERAERRLLAAETVAALRSLRTGEAYPGAALRLAWRDLMRNHPHDSICGCSCDEVHRDMLVRYEQLERTVAAIERDALGLGEAWVNPLPYPRSRLVEQRGQEGLVTLAGFEGAVVSLSVAETGPLPQKTAIDNGVLRLELDGNGTLTLTDLRRGVRLEALHAVEDEPDVGDLYTFCSGGPVEPAKLLEARVLRNGPLVWELLFQSELPGVELSTVARLVRGIDRLEFRTTVENRGEDHRLRVRFPVPNDGTSRAASQFAVVHRPAPIPAAERPDWVEPPVPTAHMLGAVAVGPLVLLTKGLPEIEVDPASLRLTLLRCTGTISQPSGLETRPLGAGPPVATPEGQCPGRHVLEYALRLDGERLSDAALVRAGQDYRTEFLVGEPFAAPLELDGDVVFSCLKGAEDGDGLVLRVFNPGGQQARLALRGAGAERIRLDEEQELGAFASPGELGPGEIATLRLLARSPD